MKNKGTMIGRWYVSVYAKDQNTYVAVYDTNYTSDLWVSDLNPKGYQPTGGSYYLETFITHEGALSLWGEVEDWTMTSAEVYNAQAFAYLAQSQWSNAKHTFFKK